MKRLALSLAIAFLLGGCATQALLQQPIEVMDNASLLRYYYTLLNESDNSDRGVRNMQTQYAYDRWRPGTAIGNQIVTGIIAGQGDAVRRRAIDARVELERRGWTPARGLPETQPGFTALPAATTPILMGATPTSGRTSLPPAKWGFTAERTAKAEGCESPTAGLGSVAPAIETFTVTCSNLDPLAVRCESGQCRILR